MNNVLKFSALALAAVLATGCSSDYLLPDVALVSPQMTLT
ncbi:hypothetical protein ACIO0C_30195, partial [Pseudomonas sp. NPDC087336]